MRGKWILITAMASVLMFGAGLLGRGLWNQPRAAMAKVPETTGQQGLSPQAAAGGYLSADEIRVRVNDGDVEWYDGRLWHRVASVEELVANDKFYVAQEKYGEFEEQLRQEEAVQQQKGTLLAQRQAETSVWQKDAPAPASTPKPSSGTRPQTAVTAPVQTPGTPQQSAGNDSSNDDSNDNDNSTSAPAEPPADTPVEPPSDAGGSDTGDGENMEWSDDYL